MQSPDKNSDDLIFIVLKDRLADQLSSIQALDGKAALTLSFTGAIIAGLVNSNWFLGSTLIVRSLILACLLVASIMSLFTVLVREFRSDPEPDGLVNGYVNKSEKVTKGQLIKNFQDSYNNNKKSIRRKGFALNGAFIALAGSVVLLCVLVLFTNPK